MKNEVLGGLLNLARIKKAFASEEEAKTWLGQNEVKEAFKKEEPKEEE